MQTVQGSLGKRPVLTILGSINDKSEAVGAVCTTGVKAQFCRPLIARSGGITQPAVLGQGTKGGFVALNNRGQIAGNGPDTGSNTLFIYKPGTSLQLINPGLNFAEIASMNKHGSVVGSGMQLSSTSNFVGFLFEGGQTTTFAIPTSTGTFPTFIGDSGVIAGIYSRSGGHDSGFVRRDNGKLLNIHFLGSIDTRAQVIGPGGQVIGTYLLRDGQFTQAFSFLDGAYTTLLPTYHNVFINSVNAASTIVGSYFNPTTATSVPFIATCATGPGTCTE